MNECPRVHRQVPHFARVQKTNGNKVASLIMGGQWIFLNERKNRTMEGPRRRVSSFPRVAFLSQIVPFACALCDSHLTSSCPHSRSVLASECVRCRYPVCRRSPDPVHWAGEDDQIYDAGMNTLLVLLLPSMLVGLSSDQPADLQERIFVDPSYFLSLLVTCYKL